MPDIIIKFKAVDNPPPLVPQLVKILELKQELEDLEFSYDLELKVKLHQEIRYRSIIFNLLGGEHPNIDKDPIVDKLLNGVPHEDISVLEFIHLLPYLAPVLHPDTAVEWLMTPEDSLPRLIAIRILERE